MKLYNVMRQVEILRPVVDDIDMSAMYIGDNNRNNQQSLSKRAGIQLPVALFFLKRSLQSPGWPEVQPLTISSTDGLLPK